MLKNVGSALPLNKPKTIGIVGNGAGPSSKGPNGYTDRGGDDGVLAMGWGSGYATVQLFCCRSVLMSVCQNG